MVPLEWGLNNLDMAEKEAGRQEAALILLSAMDFPPA
jgi:hypothetical protein